MSVNLIFSGPLAAVIVSTSASSTPELSPDYEIQPKLEPFRNRTHPSSDEPIVFISLKEFQRRVSLGRSSLYNRWDSKSKYFDPRCPRPIRISANRIAVVEDEVTAYQIALVQASRETRQVGGYSTSNNPSILRMKKEIK